MQKSGIEYRNLTARKRKNSFIAHAAELAGERAPIHAEKIGKCGTRIWQGIHAVIIGRERLQIDFQSITQALLSYLDVLVDGPFIAAQKNLSLRFRGSSNQRLIDVPASLKTGQIILWDERQ